MKEISLLSYEASFIFTVLGTPLSCNIMLICPLCMCSHKKLLLTFPNCASLSLEYFFLTVYQLLCSSESLHGQQNGGFRSIRSQQLPA